MKKLTRNLIVGTSATVTVGGGAAGAAVALSNKKDGQTAKAVTKTNAVDQIVKPKVEVKTEEHNELPGQDELKSAQYAAEHNLLKHRKRNGKRSTQEHIEATDIKTEVPHAMEFFAYSSKEEKAHARYVELQAELKANAAKEERIERELAEAKRVAMLPEASKDIKTLARLNELKEEARINFEKAVALEQELARVKEEANIKLQEQNQKEAEKQIADAIRHAVEAEAFDTHHIVVDVTDGQDGQRVVELQDITNPEDKQVKLIPIPKFNEQLQHRQEVVQEVINKAANIAALEAQSWIIDLEQTAKEVAHQMKIATEELATKNEEVQNELEEFVNTLNHHIHEIAMEHENEVDQMEANAQLASKVVAQLTKGNNQGQVEASEQAKLMEAGAKAFADDLQEQMMQRRDALHDARHEQSLAEQELQAKVDEQAQQAADLLKELAHQTHEAKLNKQANKEQLQEANANADFAKAIVTHITKGNNQGQVEGDRINEMMRIGAEVISANAQGELLVKAENMDKARHEARVAEAEMQAQQQHTQEQVDDFLNALEHRINELNKEHENEVDQMEANAQLAAKVVAQLTKGNNQGQVEASEQAKLMEAGAKAFASDINEIVNERLDSINQARHEEAKAEEKFLEAKEEHINAIIEAAKQMAHQIHEAKLEEENLMDANEETARQIVSQITKGNNGPQVLSELQAQEAKLLSGGVNVFIKPSHELSREEVAAREKQVLDSQNAVKDAVATRNLQVQEQIREQAVETAKNYALAESEIENRLHQRQEETKVLEAEMQLAAEKAAQELYETQRHGSEVDAIAIAQRVMAEEKAEYEAEARGEMRQNQMEEASTRAQALFDSEKREDSEMLMGDKRSGQDDYEASQRAHAARLAGEASAREFAAEMAAAQAHAEEVKQAGETSNKQTEEQHFEQTVATTQAYEEHKNEVAQVLEERHKEDVQKDLDAAQIKLVADAHRIGATELTDAQMHEANSWVLINKQQASEFLPSKLVDTLFASAVVDQVNIQITQNEGQATMYAIAYSNGENANGAIGYAEFAITKHVERPIIQFNGQIGGFHFGSQQQPATQFVDYVANQAIYNANNAGAITVTTRINNGMTIDLFHPPRGVRVSSAFLNELKSKGVTSAQAIILNKGLVVGQGTYGSNVRFILNGHETIHETYFAIRTF